MAAASIIVELLMKTGSFETDTARAGKSLKRLQKESEATARAVALSFAAVGAATAAIGAAFTSSLASIDRFNDLKDATGASIENISALDRLARETGASFETVEASLIKLNQALNSAKPDSDAERALKAIGLSAKELKALDPAEAFRRIAVALSGFADDGTKARIVQELFGKSLKEVAPLLVDVAKKGELVATQTTAQAEAVEAYRKQSFKLKTDIEDLTRQLSVAFVPALISATQQIKEMFGASAGQETLNRRIINALQDVANEEARLAKGDGLLDIALYGTKETREANLASAKKRLAEARALYQAVVGTSKAGAGRGMGGYDLPSVGDIGEPDKRRKADKARDDFGPLMKQISEKIALDRAELDGVGALTEAQKMQAKIFADINGGYIKLTAAQKQSIDFALQEALGLEKLTDQRKRDAEWTATATDQNAAYLEALQGRRDALEADARAAEYSLAVIGKTPEQLEALEIARLRDEAALLRHTAAQADNLLISDAIAASFLGQAAALDRLANATGAGAEIKRIHDEAKAVSDVLENSLANAFGDFVSGASSAKVAFRNFSNSVISELARIQAKKIAMSLVSGGGFSDVLGFIGSLFGAFTGGGGSSVGYGIPSGVELATGTNRVPYDNFPALLHKDEAVVPAAYNPAVGGKDRTVVNVINNTGAAVRQERKEVGGREMIDVIIGTVAKDMNRGGPTRQAARAAVGPRARRG